MQPTPVVAPAIIVHQSPPQYQARDFRHDPVLATEEKYCFQTKTKLKVHDKILSSTLKFLDETSGKSIIKCEGKVFSLTDKKVLKDSEDGQVICTIKKELKTLAGIYKIYNKGNKEICKISEERTACKAKFTGHFTDAGNRHPERKILVKANLERKHCCIYLQEESYIVMANMEKVPHKVANSPIGEDEYLIEIEAGVDAALILALCVVVMNENAAFNMPRLAV